MRPNSLGTLIASDHLPCRTMPSDLPRLLRYDAWANRAVLESVIAHPEAPARARAIMMHVMAAEVLWLARIHDAPAPLPVWPEFDAASCAQRLGEAAAAWKAVLSGNKLERAVSYTNSKGEPWTSTVRDIILHIITHSAYHRGQIATLLGAVGATPASTDFIHAVREKHVD